MNTEPSDRIAGWVDSRRRPLINLQVWRSQVVSALVDTGFNGYLLWECKTTDLSDFPGELSPLYESVEVAGGTILVALATAQVHWFEEEGAFTTVETLVSAPSKQSDNQKVYVGTALLSGMALAIDFLNETLRIERST